MLRLKEGTEQAYDQAHAQVWPEMLALLKSVGFAQYSIFRRETLLFLVLQAENFEAAWATLDKDPVNLRWQTAMSAYFADAQDTRPGERFPMMQEVFFLP
jgi:L-rhamnose mutarotase